MILFRFNIYIKKNGIIKAKIIFTSEWMEGSICRKFANEKIKEFDKNIYDIFYNVMEKELHK